MAMFDPIDKIHDAHYERMKKIRQERIDAEKRKATEPTNGLTGPHINRPSPSYKPTHGGWPVIIDPFGFDE